MNDIFADPPLPKAFYHPSRAKDVSQFQSTARLDSDGTELLKENLRESYLDGEFLKGGHTYKRRILSTRDADKMTLGQDTSSRFDESWPESERPSTVDIPELPSGARDEQSTSHIKGYIFEVPERDNRTKSKKSATVEPSTLAKYIERFRHGQPMSRAERERVVATDDEDFWWLSRTEPSDTSTPKDDTVGQGVRTRTRTRQDREDKENRKHISLKEYSRQGGVLLDKDLQLLHDKADRLLEKTGSSLNSSEPIVSTEGLGSAGDSTTGTSATLNEAPYQPHFVKNKDCVLLTKPLNPEEDILAQWRLRRKMDMMKSKDPILGNAAKASDRELNCKLAAFRKRLEVTLKDTNDGTSRQVETSVNADRVRERLLSAHKPPAGGSTFTPAPTVHQVDTECQTSPHVSSPVVTTVKTTDPTDGLSAIASPNLPLGRSDRSTVQPHRHLSCDIIPCPVIARHDTCHSEYVSDNRGLQSGHSYRDEKKHSEKSIRDKHRNHPDEHTPHNVCDSSHGDRRGDDALLQSCEDSDSSFERMKMKHLKLLKQEHLLRRAVGGRRRTGGEPRSHDREREERREPRSHDREREERREPRSHDREREERREPRSHDREKEERREPRSHDREREERREPRSHEREREERREPRSHDREREERREPSSHDGDRTETGSQERWGHREVRREPKSHDKKRKENSSQERHRENELVSHDRGASKTGDVRESMSSDEVSVERCEPRDSHPSSPSWHLHNGQANVDQNTHKTRPQQKLKDDKLSTCSVSTEEDQTSTVTSGKPKNKVNRNKCQTAVEGSMGAVRCEVSTAPPGGNVPAPGPTHSVEEPEFGGSRRAGRKWTGKPLHSSPIPSVNSAIGQIVGEHLFVSSEWFTSSVDSVRPQTKGNTPTIHEQPEPLEKGQGDLDLSGELLSDGEEFKGDEILCDLRNRRRSFLDQLRRIDDLIERNDASAAD